jgi:tetratricopeptide (TPR) repeat protein
MTKLCDDAAIQALTRNAKSDATEQLTDMERLLADYPEDPRLHFVYGSTLIAAGRMIEAHRSLTQAVTLAPDFAIARFQLGLFQLTSGEANAALETWGRLDRLPDTHYLRWFVDGLRCLIRDDFIGTIESLRKGIALNSENPPLNNDMQMVIDRCLPLLGTTRGDPADGAVSETALILGQFADRHKLN